MRILLLFSCLLSAAFAHRLDEYLQAAVFSLENGQLRAQLRMTPGVAVLPVVLAAIDTNGDGEITEREQTTYGRRVASDLALSMDGQAQSLALAAVRFPPMDQLRQGLGEIEIDLAPMTVSGRRSRHHLSFRNLHQRPVSVYLANFLAPASAEWRIEQQHRNFEQSEYQAQFSRRGMPLMPVLWVSAAAMALVLWRARGARVETMLVPEEPTQGRRTPPAGGKTVPHR